MLRYLLTYLLTPVSHPKGLHKDQALTQEFEYYLIEPYTIKNPAQLRIIYIASLACGHGRRRGGRVQKMVESKSSWINIRRYKILSRSMLDSQKLAYGGGCAYACGAAHKFSGMNH